MAKKGKAKKSDQMDFHQENKPPGQRVEDVAIRVEVPKPPEQKDKPSE
jgi:hypothetical protein